MTKVDVQKALGASKRHKHSKVALILTEHGYQYEYIYCGICHKCLTQKLLGYAPGSIHMPITDLYSTFRAPISS